MRPGFNAFGGKVGTSIGQVLWADVRGRDERNSASRTHDTALGVDGVQRPRWAQGSKPVRDYYDHVWGIPRVDEAEVFEALCFAVFQTGLAVRLIADKWEQIHTLCAGFQPDVLAEYTPAQVDRLISDPQMIRNAAKVSAIVRNAQATVQLRESGGLPRLIWSHQPEQTPRPTCSQEVPRRIPASEKLAVALRENGFVYVGATMACFLMGALGVIDLALVDTPARGRSGLWHEDGTRRCALACGFPTSLPAQKAS